MTVLIRTLAIEIICFVCKNYAKLSGYDTMAWISIGYINCRAKTSKIIHRNTCNCGINDIKVIT